MRILFVITKTEAGGAQTHVHQMSRALRERGHEPRIMGRPGGWLETAARQDGISFHSNPHLSNSINPLADLRAALTLARVLRAFHPDLVSCHSSKAGIITRLIVRGRVPTVFTAHGWGFAERGWLLARLVFIPCEKLAARYTARLICVSSYLRDVALRHRIASGNKLTVIHNGVETVPDKTLNGRERGPLKILFVGRLVSQKDPETVLRAYAALPESVRRRARLHLIGEGDKRRALEAFVRDRGLDDSVRFLGAVDRSAVLDELRRGDIFVLTTHYEGLPRTVIEAMHAGLPVVASDVWGVSELFGDAGAGDDIGILVAESSVDQVRAALQRLIQEPALRDAMGRAARTRARRCFSLDRMVEDTLSVYREVMR